MVIAHGQVLKLVFKPRGRHMISIPLESGKGQTAARDYTIEHTIITECFQCSKGLPGFL